MEAKGCARPAVWKEARRYFYWATRARIARSSSLARLAAASPKSTLEYRERLLNSLAQIDETADNQTIAKALEALDLNITLMQLRSEHFARRVLEATQEDRKVALDGLLHLFDRLSEDEKSSLLSALNSTRSPGTSS